MQKCYAFPTDSNTLNSLVSNLSTVEWHFNLYKTASNGNSFQILKGQILALNYVSVKLSYFFTLPLPVKLSYFLTLPLPSLTPTILCGRS